MRRIRPFKWLRCVAWKILRAYHLVSMTEPTYDHDKFAELLVYIASRVGNDPTNGDTKLNKLLYFSDVTAYRRTGQPISGARYQHQTYGPIAVPLIPVREELTGTRLDVAEQELPTGGTQRRTKALDDPDTAVFTEDEIEIIDEVIERFRDCRAKEMADFAHGEPAWIITQDGDDMSYRASLLARRASPAALDFGKKLAERLGC